MTKLMEWITVFVIYASIWLGLITETIPNSIMTENPMILYASPIVLLGLFGVYAATVVLYRVFTFNNCEEAASELQKEIQEAKGDLKSKGFIFKS